MSKWDKVWKSFDKTMDNFSDSFSETMDAFKEAMDEEFNNIIEEHSVTFEYTNWKGVKKKRRVVPVSIRYASTKYHKEDQWLLKGYDLDKKAMREFAMKDIKEWK